MQVTYESGGVVRIWFDHAKGLKLSTGRILTGFEISDKSGLLFPAHAVIDGETVVLSSPHVDRPVNVRYAFKVHQSLI
ncbi:hypothetical protein [Sphingobacterium sp. SGR-19]|uniref:hypothetical protein n=1 Tax=Sphingobacterium sp. SGR-19 TaxID=2710886 RepID=UPI0013EE20A6|nr:hypothetical protein [Sphingobacterium sp. SGR-19]NGM66832.1 hypothetical protein [Sphingobacterium sp. SGR-19]